MPRKKEIDSKTIIELTDAFVLQCRNGIATGVTYGDIAKYIQENGFPNFNRKKFERDSQAVAHLKALQNSARSLAPTLVSAYKTLDIDAFLCKSPLVLRQDLSSLDTYYRNMANSAHIIYEESKSLKSDLDIKAKQLEDLQTQVKMLEQNIEALRTVQKTNQKLWEYITSYLTPDICNQILAKSNKSFTPALSHISIEYLDKNIISLSTALSPILNIVETEHAPEKQADDPRPVSNDIDSFINNLFDLREDPNG